MPSDTEILAAIRSVLEQGPIAPAAPPARPMQDALVKADRVLDFGAAFESLWEYWCTPCDHPKWLVKLFYNFVGIMAKSAAQPGTYGDMFNLDIPDHVLEAFRSALQEMSRRNWNYDLSLNVSPHASTGGGTPPISIPGGG